MVIESVAAAGMLLNQINQVIQQVNETGSGVQQAMGLISDFGEALNTFEVDRKNSTFKALSQNDILKIQMLRRQYERHWQSVNDLLLVADPKLLEDFKRAKKEQEEARQRHLAMLARKKKARAILISQILVGGTTLLLGGAIAVGTIFIVIKIFG
jgi:wobble nucleotide-excising tRNase